MALGENCLTISEFWLKTAISKDLGPIRSLSRNIKNQSFSC